MFRALTPQTLLTVINTFVLRLHVVATPLCSHNSDANLHPFLLSLGITGVYLPRISFWPTYLNKQSVLQPELVFLRRLIYSGLLRGVDW